MNTNISSFQHVSTIFTQISFNRTPNLPETIEAPVKIETKIVDNIDLPQRVQINLRVHLESPESFKFSLEAVGLFDYTNPDIIPTRQEKMDFLRKRGIHIVWISITHMIRLITVEMGIPPLQLITPDDFNTEQLEINYLAKT